MDAPERKDDRPSPHTLFLGLFLLLLAFFILLNSISVRERPRVDAVIGSVTTKFNRTPTFLRPEPLSSLYGPVPAVQEAQRQVRGLIKSAFPLARVQMDERGNVMRVAVPTSTMFASDQSAPRAEHGPFLDQLADALASEPLGWRYEVEFLIGSAPLDGEMLATGSNLEIRRAGGFARALRSRGVSAASIAAGLGPGDGQTIELLFRLRAADAPGLDLGRSEWAP